MEVNARALGIDRLSVAERLRLVEEIWDGIAAESEALDIPQSHRDMLDRRIEAHERDPRAGSSWDEVLDRLTGGRGID